MKSGLSDNSIGFPAPDRLPNDDRNTPYFILGDDAFGLRTFLMKPYSKQNMSMQEHITDYRISIGRRVVENAFGITAQKWRVLLTTMELDPDNARLVVETCCVLHNMMRTRYPSHQNAHLDYEDDDHNLVPGAWRLDSNMHDMEQVIGGNRDSVAAKKQREYLKLYFNSPAGSVPWQEHMVPRH